MFKLKNIATLGLCTLLTGCCSDETRDKALLGGACLYLGSVIGYASFAPKGFKINQRGTPNNSVTTVTPL